MNQELIEDMQHLMEMELRTSECKDDVYPDVLNTCESLISINVAYEDQDAVEIADELCRLAGLN